MNLKAPFFEKMLSFLSLWQNFQYNRDIDLHPGEMLFPLQFWSDAIESGKNYPLTFFYLLPSGKLW